MPDSCWVWQSQRRAFVVRSAQPSEWPNLLLLCRNCQAAASMAPAPALPLALPHRDRTFAVNGPSLFVYALQSVQRVFLKEDGSPAGAAETVERVIVEATTPAAQETIDYFALNTRYYDRSANTLRIPRIDYDSLVDRRLDLRTEAWEEAATHGAALKQAEDPAQRRVFLVAIRQMMAGRGFWSTWVTVLWRELADRSTVATLALPPRVSGLATATQPLAGAAQDFPGTRGDWLS